MPADPRLLALPSLRRQAEADARELFDRGHAVAQSFGFESPMWELLREDERTAVIENHARGLADPTRWQSQAWALRRIAELVRFSIGDSVPTIRLIPDEKRVVWIVECGTEAHCFTLPDATSRPEAIAAILLHLESQ